MGSDPNNPYDLLGWKLWYADGSTVSSEESTWEDAPQHGVIALVRYWLSGGREVVNGPDLYTRERGDCLKLIWPPEIKVGALLPNDEYAALAKLVYADQEIITRMI